MSAARLFLALWPPDEVRAQLAAWRDGWDWPKGASPVATERLHVTLHFIGDVPAERVASLQDSLGVPLEPFELEFGRNVLWDHGIAVLEPNVIPPALLRLQNRLGVALEQNGLPLDARPYRPHVTFARRAKRAAPSSDGPAIRWVVDRYALVQSENGYRGSLVGISVDPAYQHG